MERIHVSVRARPLSAEDAKSSPLRISGNCIFIPNQTTKFEFDRIFGEDCNTQEVYSARTRHIVEAAVGGFNGTVFAYGQTSSGKTHTMRGSVSEPGVIPRAVHDLFGIIQQEMGREFLLRMSYMEIYNEEVNDLLAPEHRKLQIHESVERGVFVAGLREEIVASPDQILELMEFGESHRHVGETNMNVYSSRSHTIFRMIIESREKAEDAQAEFSCDAVRVSILNLVDLAGSERAAKTGAEGVRLKEGSHINKSLMTLGTVIKKLSEGVESQRGHVPYRDSKLTRILQSALGGNSNTAIICNITLAQIHADETKSSLQFASRALRVTNCAHVNEILTDAALLKCQKKEIEELRGKLQGLHSEHLEEEILNLRNTLLKSELERERMALELEEEKRAQAERERKLQEQAKKIENLSSMVLCANREETCDVYKKAKRRDTWCPGNIGRKKLKELSSAVKENTSDVKPTRDYSRMAPFLSFEELDEASADEPCKQEKDLSWSVLEDCALPAPQTLLHVTNRRKVPPRKKSLPRESNDLVEMQTEYETLLFEFETQRIMSDIQIDCLTRKLAEADLVVKCKDRTTQNTNSESCSDGNTSFRESDAILIKKLQEKISILEMENSSSQENLDCVFDLETEHTKSAQEKYEKLYEELMRVQEATLARDKLASAKNGMEEADCLTSLLTEAQEVKLKLEFEHSKHLIGSLSSVVDELLHFSSVVPNMMLFEGVLASCKNIQDLKPSSSQSLEQIESIVRSHEKLQSCLMNKITELENEKLALCNQASDHRKRIEELSLEVQDSANLLMELNEEHEAEKAEFVNQLQLLQREISSLSSCSLAKEKENIRKELEKTKIKLKDMEFKLRNAVQEKTKLEGEKSVSERELKRLQNQKATLERDMSKRESIIGKRHDSTTDRSLNVFDHKRSKGPVPLAELKEYKKLELFAFEMETTIASLEDELAIAQEEKDVANSRAESLSCDLQALSDDLQLSNSELSKLEEGVSVLRTSLEDCRCHAQEMESSLKSMSEEKEELSMQLTDMEEDKAIWVSKERACMEAIGVKEKAYTNEIASLAKKLSEVTSELEICRKKCQDFEERLTRSEQNAPLEKQCRCFKEKLSDNNLCTFEQHVSDVLSEGSAEKNLKLCEEIEILQLELSDLRKENQCLLVQVQELEGRPPVPLDDSQVLKSKHELKQQNGKLTSMEDKIRNDQVKNSKEKAKLRMRLQGAQAKLDTFRVRYKETVDELDYMNKRFVEASAKLKKQLAEYGSEVLSLQKQLAAAKER